MAARYIEVNATLELEPMVVSAHIDENMPLGPLNVHNYNKLINKPQINGVELVGDKSLKDLGIFQEIERQVTAHNNDKEAHVGYYEWRGIVKTEEDLPTKDMRSGDVYHITSRSSFGMEETNVVWYEDTTKDAGGYWTVLGQDAITDYATYQQVLDILNEAIQIDTGYVGKLDTLPEKGTEGIIYLVAHEDNGNSKDKYDEYIWVVDRYELVGTTTVDLSEYTKKTDLAALDSRIAALEQKDSESAFVKRITKSKYDDLTGVTSQNGVIYYITDYKENDDGTTCAAMCSGDGNAYIGDLPLTVGISTKEQEILNSVSEKVGCRVNAKDAEMLEFYY